MQYLLGKLSKEETARLEERSFTDDSVFEEIEVAEDELIDAYVGKTLSSEDRKLFEYKLSNSERLKERVEFAKLLPKQAFPSLVDPDPVKWWDHLFNFSFVQNPAFRGAVVAGLFLAILGIPAFVWIRSRDARRLDLERAAIEQQKQQLEDQLKHQQTKTTQLETELLTSKQEEERLQEELVATQALAQANNQPIPPVSATLFSDSTRAPGQRDSLNVPSTASTIRLELVLDSDNYASYQATINSPSGTVLPPKAGLKTRPKGRTRIIVLQFPSRLLHTGEYVVSVSGRTPSDTYEHVADYPVSVKK